MLCVNINIIDNNRITSRYFHHIDEIILLKTKDSLPNIIDVKIEIRRITIIEYRFLFITHQCYKLVMIYLIMEINVEILKQ